MHTVQTNVRVPPDDKPIIRAIAVRLRNDMHFRERLQALLTEDPSPALEARIARLEAQVQRILAGPDDGSCDAPNGEAEGGRA